jgi:chromosome segregation ATPase
MNNKTAVVVLVALSVLLGFGLLMRHTNAVEQKKKDDGTIATLEGDVKKTTGELTEQKKVNETLTKTNEVVTAGLIAKTAEARALDAKVQATAAELAQTASALTRSQAETKAAQAEGKRVETALTAAKTKAEAEALAAAQAAAARYAALDTSKKQEIATRDASIKDLQNTRDQLNAKVAELNTDITKLKSTIGTRRFLPRNSAGCRASAPKWSAR